ncbi:MAG: metallophosphatase family protein [Clostridiales bacterium]|nr:metallophosphatase family protein [Clostridiales bacterium]MCF8023709.1 metallophosphatase family protein [Clostridiales bacterium]
MKIAVFSDIHGNIHALEEVIKSINSQKPDLILCLGDLVGYGAFPGKVVETIIKNNILTVMGNYDDTIANQRVACGCDFKNDKEQELGIKSIQWTTENTSKENKEFLRSLPGCIKKEISSFKIMFVHGSPRSLNEYLYEDTPYSEILKIMDEAGINVLVCGHTHLPYHRKIETAAGIYHIINAGSTGKPKHGDPQAVYALIEAGKNIKVDFIKVPYDHESAAKAVEKAGLPIEFTQIIRTGITT